MMPAEEIASAVSPSILIIKRYDSKDTPSEAELTGKPMKDVLLDYHQSLLIKFKGIGRVILVLDSMLNSVQESTRDMRDAIAKLNEAIISAWLEASKEQWRKMLTAMVNRTMDAGEEGMTTGYNAERSVYLENWHRWKALGHYVAFTELLRQAGLVQGVVARLKSSGATNNG
jgi:hypothetical protein